MNLASVGKLLAAHRRARNLTVGEVAKAAGVGRSTLAALEAGKLPELGFAKVERLCAALDLILEARPPHLAKALMDHRHLTDSAGRELTKAAIEDVITRGDVTAWRGLVRAARADKTGQILRRVRDVANAAGKQDEKARAFGVLLPGLVREKP
jgi:transcriptional regulator with XRE-family HTH domain